MTTLAENKPADTHTALSLQELDSVFHEAIKAYHGNSEKLVSAIGVYVMATKLGWKPIYLMHGRSTIKEYEKLLGVDIRATVPELGELADKSRAWRIAQKLSNFWKAVKGEIPNVRSTQMDKI